MEQELLIKLKNGDIIPFKPGWENSQVIDVREVDSIYKFQMRDAVFSFTTKCQLNCFFCRDGVNRSNESDQELSLSHLKSLIDYTKDTISFEGWEPTLFREKLLTYIKFAKNEWVRELILVTNAVLLVDGDYCQKLIEAGITLFNINVAAHTEELFEKVYRADKKLFHLRNVGIRNLIDLWQGGRVRFNFVVNSYNYEYLLDYALWVYKNFPEIFYIELNFVKVLGYVKEWKSSVMPSLVEVSGYLMKMLRFCDRVWIRVIVEWIPLCYLRWYEHLNIDVDKYLRGDFTFMAEKEKQDKCKECSLYKICSGFRLKYFSYYSHKHIRPNCSLSVDDVIRNYNLYSKRKFLYKKYER